MGWFIGFVIVALLLGGLWLSRRGDSQALGDPFRAIVLMEQEPRVAAIEHVRSALARQNISPLDITDAGAGEVKVQLEKGVITIISAARPYTMVGLSKEKMVKGLQEQRLKDAIMAHQAFISVWVDDRTPRENRAELNPLAAQIAGELIDTGTLAIWETASGQMNIPTDGIVDRLKSGALGRDLGDIEYDAVIDVDPGDEGVNARATEAQARWPEFVDAFRAQDNPSSFLVKARFELPDGSGEHMWIDVKSCDMLSASGTLANKPYHHKHLQYGDSVRVSFHDISDWATPDGPFELRGD